jgi:predicted transcriptional regulator
MKSAKIAASLLTATTPVGTLQLWAQPERRLSMAKALPPPLSDAQLEIMNIVWDRGETTVAEVWKTLAARRAVARNTVSTMVTRLEEKGWLRHRVKEGSYLFSAAYPREKVLPRIVRRLVDAAFQGSAEGLVLALLEGGRLSREEVERIRAILDRADAERQED